MFSNTVQPKRVKEGCRKVHKNYLLDLYSHQYYSGNKTKEHKMCKHEACTDGKKNAHRFLVGRD